MLQADFRIAARFICGVISLVVGFTGFGASSAHAADTPAPVLLVLTEGLQKALGDNLPEGFISILHHELDPDALVAAAAAGDSLVWIAPPENLPPELWVRAFSLSAAAVDVRPAAAAPIALPPDMEIPARAQSAYLFPSGEFPRHNVDEEIRADFLPLLEAYDSFGELIGYPGVLMSHVAPSLAGSRFQGSQTYFFFFEHPEEDVSPEQWHALLQQIGLAHQSQLVVERVESNYASFSPGERIQMRVRVRNGRPDAAAVNFRFHHRGPQDTAYLPVTEIRRVAGAGSTTEALLDFLPDASPGLHHLRVEVLQDLAHATELAVIGNPKVIAQRELGFVILDEDWSTPELLTVEGTNLLVEGQPAFLAGTHYYPSNVWWEWAWRDFRPMQANRDFWGMRRGGNRLVRVWVDPVLDEPVLRALDAAVWLAAQHGIALDVCVFNQWVRDLGFERENGERVDFQFRHPADFNLYSISLRNLDLQREYAGILARRWQRAGNVIFNLANETYLKNPDTTQMDPEAAQWEEAQGPAGARRDSLLFRRWGDEMARAIRAAGGKQLVFPGYMFGLSDGGDTYLANRHAPIMPWHGYFAPEAIGQTIHYYDPTCSGRPLFLQEFGALGWNPAAHYDAAMHYALAAGAAGAMSYEWGVSWLAHEAPYVPLPIRDALAEDPDPRWFAPIIDYARENTTPEGVGLAPWPSGFGYASIYPGTPFMADAARAVWRLAYFGDLFSRGHAQYEVYVIIPEASFDAIAPAQELFKSLWLEGVQFGVLQAECLGAVPPGARVLLCPAPLGEAQERQLQEHAGRGMTVLKPGSPGWRAWEQLPRVHFSPRGAINALSRPTKAGTLFSFLTESIETALRVQLAQREIELGLASYALIHETPDGINFLEATGEVVLNGAPLLDISGARVLVAAAEGEVLEDFGAWTLIAEAPCTLTFPQGVEEVAALLDREVAVEMQHDRGSNVLTLEETRVRYPLRIRFVKE